VTARCNPAARDQFGCVGNGKTQPAVTRRLCAVQVRIRATPTKRTQLERDDVLRIVISLYLMLGA